MVNMIGYEDDLIHRTIIDKKKPVSFTVDTYNIQNRKITIAYAYVFKDNTFNGKYGYAICNPEDKFVRPLGETIAVGRLHLKSGSDFKMTIPFVGLTYMESLFSEYLCGILDRISYAIINMDLENIAVESVEEALSKAKKDNIKKIAKNHLPPL